MFLNVNLYKIASIFILVLGATCLHANDDVDLFNQKSSFQFIEKYNEEYDIDYYEGTVKYDDKSYNIGTFEPLYNNGIEILGHFYLNVDTDKFPELVVVAKSSIRPNEAVGNWGSSYDVHIFDDFNNLNDNKLTRLVRLETLFDNIDIDGSFNGRKWKTPIIKNNPSTKPFNHFFIERLLKNYQSSPVKIIKKSYLYNFPNEKTENYLIKNDEVTVLYEDFFFNKKWYFINYKGTRDLNMWIQAKSLDTTRKLAVINSEKESLYKQPNQKTKMYLIKGDKVTIFDQKTDNSNQKWYFINFKGTKDLNMWIKAEAVDIPDNKDIPKEEKPVLEEVSKIPQSSTSSPNTLAVTKEKPSITATDKIIATKVDQKKSAGGSIPLLLIASLLSVFTFKFS